jgi:hypothetical protein
MYNSFTMNAYLSTFNYTRIGPLSPYLYGIQHLKFACQPGSLGGRMVHLIVGLSELIPGLNNIIAFAEHYFTYRHCLKTLGAPHQNELRRCGIESMADLQALGVFKTRTAVQIRDRLQNSGTSNPDRRTRLIGALQQNNDILPNINDIRAAYLDAYLSQRNLGPAWSSLKLNNQHKSLATYPESQVFSIGASYGVTIPRIII